VANCRAKLQSVCSELENLVSLTKYKRAADDGASSQSNYEPAARETLSRTDRLMQLFSVSDGIAWPSVEFMPQEIDCAKLSVGHIITGKLVTCLMALLAYMNRTMLV
jgi:hypothetical protein